MPSKKIRLQAKCKAFEIDAIIRKWGSVTYLKNLRRNYNHSKTNRFKDDALKVIITSEN